jgi:hypothetical protein
LTDGLAEAVDELYRDVVMEPGDWGEQAFVEWLDMIARDRETVDRGEAKQLRRALRIASKLQGFWADADAGRRAEQSWQARVDIAVGIPAWRPTLELAMMDLEDRPSQERFDDVRRRFRVVNGAPWQEGVSFADWTATRVRR